MNNDFYYIFYRVFPVISDFSFATEKRVTAQILK